jgi:AcrR family transcriptional regulator
MAKGLTRDGVVAAALELVDGEGLEALGIRPLAARLGVTPMALYNHVPGKARLLDLVAERVAAEIEAPPAELPPRERLERCFASVRGACLAHPNAVPLLASTRAETPALVRPYRVSLEALGAAGLEPDEARPVFAALMSLTMGFVAYELGGHLPGLGWDGTFKRATAALLDSLAP